MVAAAPPVIAEVLPPLPAALSSFVGRERELESVLQMLGSHRLVTLTGPGGSGKTRLAIEAAPWFVPQANLKSHSSTWRGYALRGWSAPRWPIVPASGAAGPGRSRLACCATRGAPGTAGVGQVEHVLDAVPDIAALLASAPGVAVLAISPSRLASRANASSRAALDAASTVA